MTRTALLLLASVVLVLSTSLADRPAAASETEPSPDALVGEIPFHPQSPASRVMIDLAPDGQQPFVMMLDTGASGSVLTPGAARALGVSIRRGMGRPYRKGTRLGQDLQFWVDTETSDTGSRTGWDYGLLGGEFLDDYVLEIDYPGRMVRFYDPRKYAVPEEVSAPDERVISFRRNGTRIIVDLEIEGVNDRTLLDTGAPAVRIGRRTAEKAGIDWAELPEMSAYGVMGAVETYTYQAKRLRFAGFEFLEQPIAISPKGNYNQGAAGQGVLGYDLLSRFVMRIDYDNKRIWLKDGGSRVKTYWGQVQGGLAPKHRPSESEVTKNDARQRADWETQRASRRYREIAAGQFLVVEGYRLRDGPKDGETWYSHEEMVARKRAHEEASY